MPAGGMLCGITGARLSDAAITLCLKVAYSAIYWHIQARLVKAVSAVGQGLPLRINDHGGGTSDGTGRS